MGLHGDGTPPRGGYPMLAAAEESAAEACQGAFVELACKVADLLEVQPEDSFEALIAHEDLL